MEIIEDKTTPAEERMLHLIHKLSRSHEVSEESRIQIFLMGAIGVIQDRYEDPVEVVAQYAKMLPELAEIQQQTREAKRGTT